MIRLLKVLAVRKCDLPNRNIYFGALSKSSKTAKSFFLTGHLQVITRALPRIPRMETGLGFNVSSAGSAGNSPRSIISSFDSRERSTAQHPAFPFMVTIDGASRMKSVSLNSNTMNSILQVVLTLTGSRPIYTLTRFCTLRSTTSIVYFGSLPFNCDCREVKLPPWISPIRSVTVTSVNRMVP